MHGIFSQLYAVSVEILYLSPNDGLEFPDSNVTGFEVLESQLDTIVYISFFT